MGDQFARFDAGALRSLVLAQQEAHRMGHDTIGTAHLLLGVAGVAGGLAARTLAQLGVGVPVLRGVVLAHVGHGTIHPGSISVTPRAKRALEQAVIASDALRHETIRTEHVLLGLLDDDRTMAGRILANLGIASADLRERVLLSLAIPADGSAQSGEHPA